jgi:hypothetical protein
VRYNGFGENMLKKTISKNSTFVILLLFFCFISNACFNVSSKYEKNTAENNSNISNEYDKPKVSGKIETSEITESSGLAASPCQKDVFWTHNDSGDKAFVFAINSKGKKLATFNVTGAENKDWEDMAVFKDEKGECFLYVGDIGNNERLKSEFKIYRFREPEVSVAAANSSKKNPVPTETAEVIKFSYPDYRHDAETLMVHPKTGDIYILSKRLSGAASVYKLTKDLALGKTNTLEKISDFSVPAVPNGFLTGGAISPDGKRVVICDYFSAYEIALPDKTKNFDEIWKQKPEIIELGERDQGEAVCYSADGKANLWNFLVLRKFVYNQ